MVEQHGHGRARGRLVIGAVTVGAITASLGITPALAEDAGYPSWQEVQTAKRTAGAKEAEVTRITALLVGLQNTADAAGRTAQIAAERFHRAKAAQDAARGVEGALAARAAAARSKADVSRMRAGLLAAHLARTGGGDLSVTLMLNDRGADDLLYQLGTMAQLSSQSAHIYAAAVADKNSATSLEAQAALASHDLATRTKAASDAFSAARSASDAASAVVAAQRVNATRLVQQLADLRHTSSRLAAAYVLGVQQAKQAAAADASSGSPSGGGSSTAPTHSGGGTSSGGKSGGSGSGSSGSVGSSGSSGSAGAPDTAKAASAVAFARDQIGDSYGFGGAGPSIWDCSGLTMQAYASVGIDIGGHGATAQYDQAKADGQLVSYDDVAVGDLIFYTDGGGDMYHVAIYSGSGMMIEAPYDGVPVREVPVRDYQRMPVVARPTA